MCVKEEHTVIDSNQKNKKGTQPEKEEEEKNSKRKEKKDRKRFFSSLSEHENTGVVWGPGLFFWAFLP